MPRFNVGLNQREEDLLAIPINFTQAGDNTIIPGVAGLIIRVYRYFVIVGDVTQLTYKNGAVALTGPCPLTANEAMVFTFDTKPWYLMSPGSSFIINSSSGVQVSGAAYYTEENQ